MSTMHSVLTILSLIQSIYTQVVYVPDRDYKQYAAPYTNFSSQTIKVAYPINICTKLGDDTSSLWGRFQCVGELYVYGPCTGGDAYKPGCINRTVTCNVGNWAPSATIYGTSSPAIRPTGSVNLCPNKTVTTSTNYVKISLYCGFTDQQTPDCSSFDTEGFVKLSTNQCIDQEDGTYFIATCNNVSAEIAIHNNVDCTNKIGTHASYTRSCEKYAFPSQDPSKCRYFRRVTACIVNDNNILAATLEPTQLPSTQPTVSPTNNPSINPTFVPTQQPSTPTIQPSMSPTYVPTTGPTTEPIVTAIPTIYPSNQPTNNPITDMPTTTTKEDLAPDATVSDTRELLSGLNNISLVYIVCGVLFVFYLFICFYIWFNERRKRSTLKSNFQSDADKEARKEYLRQKNIQRRLELQGVDGRQGNYQQMDAQVNNNRRRISPIDQQLMSEGR